MSNKPNINEILSDLEAATRKAMGTASGRKYLLTRMPVRFRSIARFVTEYGEDRDFQNYLDEALDDVYLHVEYPVEDASNARYSESEDPEADLEEIRGILETDLLEIQNRMSMPEFMALKMVLKSGRNIDTARSKMSDEDMTYVRLRLQDAAPKYYASAYPEDSQGPVLICRGSQMSGPDIDLFEEAGLELFDEEIDGIFDEMNARDLLLECECIDEDEKYGEDWAPGMSDSYYDYYAPSKPRFQRELRDVLFAHLSV